ncbi:type I secretion system permease/ATPase [Kordiimonas lacus]|uniref:ATP-binding cassette, subfamily C n=1 Tax=Kordiimonas lacus TaxID=637679 RepID=A0A1G7F7T9_9PROT|nr:type I secretion system permease/ATPase [Kordiimonas lacus]SDE71987.1 ATP-binding cassette, subfamily C [Kordiimonas lacus]
MSLIEDYKAEEETLKKSLKKAALYSVLASFSMLAVPMFLFQVYDRVLQSRSMETLVAMAIFAIVVLIAYGVFDSVRNSLLTKAGVDMEAKVSGLLLAGELSRQHGANAQSLRDLAAIRQAVASPAFGALFDLPFIPVFMLLIFMIHPVLGVVVIIGACILAFMGVWGDRATAAENQEHMQAMVKSHQVLEMHMNSQEIIRAQGMYREVVEHWGEHQGKALDRYINSALSMTNFSSATKAIRQVIQVLMIGSGALLVLMNQATAGVIFATAMIGGRALSPVEQIVGGWRILKQAHGTRARLMTRLEEMSLPENRTMLPRPKGELRLERVVYVPQPGVPPIIKGVNGTIQAGDSIAIIGPSGAGKSTLARLIVGYLLPSAGVVSLDGQDLKVWDPVAKGLHMGYMPQQSTFFEATVRENIARLRKNDPEELAIEAAKRCGVHELLLKLPQGYDTVISKNGFYPSGGQAQLIALARAFYGNPAVLVLDEPNASLDTAGEKVFHRALHTATSSGITTIVVTQRPSVLQHVSKVMVMQDGTIKEFGPKEEVMKSGVVQAVPGKAPPKAAAKPGTAAAGQSAAADKPKTDAAKPRKVAVKVDANNAKKKEA